MYKLNSEEIEALKGHLQPSKLKEVNSVLSKLYKKLTEEEKLELYVDGASDLHSKTAGIGGVFYRNGEELYSFSDYIHDITNNEAEYSALLKGLKIACEMKLKNLKIYADSELIVKQINGEYRVRHPRMQVLYKQTMKYFNCLEGWSFIHVPREKNIRADKLSKEGRAKGPTK